MPTVTSIWLSLNLRKRSVIVTGYAFRVINRTKAENAKIYDH